MTGVSSEAGAEIRDCAGADGTGEAGADDRVAITCAGAEATGADAGSSVAPHMPQKRLVSEFSLPQRGQRTGPPPLTL